MSTRIASATSTLTSTTHQLQHTNNTPTTTHQLHTNYNTPTTTHQLQHTNYTSTTLGYTSVPFLVSNNNRPFTQNHTTIMQNAVKKNNQNISYYPHNQLPTTQTLYTNSMAIHHSILLDICTDFPYITTLSSCKMRSKTLTIPY